MPGGGLVNIAPVAPGQYRADFANGNNVLLTGKTGEDEFNRFQALRSLTSATGPNAVAGPGAGAALSDFQGAEEAQAEDAAREQIQQNLAAANTTVQGKLEPGAAPRMGNTTVVEPVGGQAEPEAAGQAAPAQAPQQATGPQSLGYTMKAVNPATGKEESGEAFRMPDGSIGIYRAPTKGTPGGFTPFGKQMIEQRTQAMQMAGAHSAEAAKYEQIGTQIAINDARARQANLEEAKVQAMLEARDAAEEEAAIQKEVAGYKASYEKARQEFADAKVDPNRYVNQTPGGNWILGLSAALGAFGAAMARTPNFAMDFINGRIADDIRAQEAAINVKGRDADNQLATLTRGMGDLQLAKKAYRQLKLEEASIESQRIANQYKGQEIAANAMKLAHQSAAESAKQGQANDQAFMEKAVTNKAYFRQGSTGSAGGFVRPQLSGVQDVKDLQATKGPQAEAEARAVESGRTEKVAAFSAGITAAIKIRNNLTNRGVEGDPVDDPTSGPLDFIGGYSANKDLARNTSQLAAAYQAGRGKSDKDAELAEQDAVGSGSGSDRVKAADEGIEKFAAGIRAELVTLPPGKREELLGQMAPEVRAAVEGRK